jgi:pyruvate dehydrogenase E1 component alpha subunit
MGTAVERASAVSEIRQKAEGYGMVNERVDGMDVMAVYEASKKAIDWVRENKKPYLLEIVTYRFRGHSMGDPERYRRQEEVHKYQENDPIGLFRKQLLAEKTAKETELEAIENKVEAEVIQAVEFAETSPEPGMEELFKDIYENA